MLNKGCVTYTCLLSDNCEATSLLACVVSFIYREVAPLHATLAPPGDTGYATWRHRVRHGGATCRHLKNLAGRPYNSQHITEYTYHTRMVCVEDNQPVCGDKHPSVGDEHPPVGDKYQTGDEQSNVCGDEQSIVCGDKH